MSSSKLPSKPTISWSPNRAEKFQPPPPPLPRFLRTNVASRSRSRTLSSPMFSSIGRKKKSDIETQEPSSPKVTCFGQVRVKRSSNSNPQNPTKTHRLNCKWLQTLFLCSRFSRRPKKPYNPFWRRWFPDYHHRKVPQVLEHSSRRDFKPARGVEEERGASIPVEVAESGVFVPSSPPKNALLLMRCRSAPHRSFNGLGMLSLSLSPPSGGRKEAEERVEEEDEEEEKAAQLGASSRPLILTRCKSEPASMTGSKIAVVDSCQTHVFID